MVRFALISLAVAMSVSFYDLTYSLITWQWPETLLLIFPGTVSNGAYSRDNVIIKKINGHGKTRNSPG